MQRLLLPRRWVVGPAAVLLTVALAACGSDSKSSTEADDSSPTTTANAPAVLATITGGEVKLVSSVRPVIDALVVALQGTDVAKARAAYADYDSAWNGIEVYVNFRDLALYTKLEKDLQDPIGAAVNADNPDLAAQVPTALALGVAFDQAIANSTKGPALSPLFDDVAALRIVRADLRRTTALLKTDIPGAKAAFASFRANYPQVEARVKARSDTADGQITAAIAAVAKEAAQPDATAATLTAPVATLSARYNYAVSLWNAAARNADLTKTTYTADDVAVVGSLRTLDADITRSIDAWKANDYPGATAALASAQTAFTAAQPALAAKKSDTSLKTALDAYSPMAAAAGDPATVPAAATAVIEAGRVGEQVIVGQFWTDPALQSAIAKPATP
ncbi:MAG: hypothetical protein QOI99_2072 [Actinomycetota bacterium]|nr:hypothetical protein [Actinomycetota bacterium]